MGEFTDLLFETDEETIERTTGEPAPAPAPQAPPNPNAPNFTDLIFEESETIVAPPQPPDEGPGFLARLGRAITGEGRRSENLPELAGITLPETLPDGTRGRDASIAIAAALNTLVDPQAVADVAVANIPGASSETDEFGNVIVALPDGQRTFVNRPGVSPTDFTQFIAQAVQFIPAARIGTFATNLAARAGLTGLAAGGTSIAQDIVGQELGSQQGVDVGRAAITAATGGAAELAAPLIGRIGEAALRRLGRLGVRDRSGGPSAATREVLSDLGVDPDDVTPEMLDQIETALGRMGPQFQRNADKTTQALIAPTVATAQAGEFGIDLTRGQATRNLRQLAREEAMRNFARGGGAGRTMQAFDERQAGQIAGGARQVQGAISGTAQGTVDDPVIAAGGIIEGLRARGAQIDDAVTQAYKAVSEQAASFDADIVRQTLPRLISARLRDANVAIFEETPAAREALKAVNRLATAGGMRGVRAIKFPAIENTRRRLNSLIESARNRGDRRAVTLIKQSFDDWVDDAFDNALLSGDEQLLTSIKRARGTRAERGRLLEPRPGDRDAGQFIEKVLETDVTNVEMANALFGNARLGQTGRSVRLVRRFRDIFGTDSREWQLLREGAFLRGLYGARGTAGDIGAQRLKSNLDEMLGPRSREFMEEIFTPDEISQLRRYRGAVADTITPSKAANPSRSGFEAARLLEDLTNNLLVLTGVAGGPGTAALAGGAGVARGATRAGAARAATRGFRLPAATAVPFTAALAGAPGQVVESTQFRVQDRR